MPATRKMAAIDFDVLLDVASATGARLTWGRTLLTRRHWVAMKLRDGHVLVRRARTRAEAAERLVRHIHQEPQRCPIRA